jgi:hypothetical protein
MRFLVHCGNARNVRSTWGAFMSSGESTRGRSLSRPLSVAAAVAALIAGTIGSADKAWAGTTEKTRTAQRAASTSSKVPALVLKHASGGARAPQHRSHSSHASHASHFSGSSPGHASHASHASHYRLLCKCDHLIQTQAFLRCDCA